MPRTVRILRTKHVLGAGKETWSLYQATIDNQCGAGFLSNAPDVDGDGDDRIEMIWNLHRYSPY